jgi:hypothetical protein
MVVEAYIVFDLLIFVLDEMVLSTIVPFTILPCYMNRKLRYRASP